MENLENERRAVIQIFGEVQGVLFRRSAQREAERLGLRGFAKNEKDGSVTIEAEGPAEKLEKFIVWCRRGSEPAKVVGVDVEYAAPLGNRIGFDIE